MPLALLLSMGWLACPGRAASSGAAPGGEPAPVSWRLQEAPHFRLYYAGRVAPRGLILDLEKLHTRLRMDLGMLAPWLSREKIQVYLYASSAAFHSGEFRPPPWSNGIALSDRFGLATYEHPERAKLVRVLSHEAAHLLFESYFREEIAAPGGPPRGPPLWLNEGLAMLMEDSVAFTNDSDRSNVWLASMRALRSYPSLEELFSGAPGPEDGDEKVQTWYVQAYSLTRFLFHQQSRVRFRSLASRLREGQSLQSAFWQSYGYKDVRSLESSWRRWLKLPERDPFPVTYSTPTFRPH